MAKVLCQGKAILGMSTNISGQMSVGFRLGTYFNYYIKNSNAYEAKVKVMQWSWFRDYFDNFL